MFDTQNPVEEALAPATTEGEENATGKVLERLERFGAALAKRRDEAVQARVALGVERRWLEDLAAYHGRDEVTGAIGVVAAASGAVPPPATRDEIGERASVYVQLTRQKTNAASARLADMLFPSDDRNWGLKPTPVPELLDMLEKGKDQGIPNDVTGQGMLQHPTEQRPLTVADIAQEQLSIAQKKATAMAAEIDDQLTECQYNYEGRKVIADAAQLGTGVLRGPFVVNRIARKWRSGEGGVQRLEILQDLRPASARVDPWHFFPDPACGENINDGAYVWERSYLSARKLRSLAGVEGYLRDQIIACLEEGPRHTVAGTSYNDLQRNFESGATQAQYNESRYEMWTYVGEADHEDLEAAGVPMPEGHDRASAYSAIVVMVNDHVIKAVLNPLDTGDFGYDVFNWERVSGSPWGVGIPYLMRYAQRTLNSAWRAMLDNMGIASGPQIVMNRGLVRPADGKWRVTARKLWFMTDAGEDVEKAFKTFNIESHQAEIQAIINLAMQFADTETSLPQIAQGEQGSAPDRVGAMTLLMNSANVMMRRLVKQFDDQITRPHITRYYHWNMEHNPKESIKGDFECDARGSTALVVRDEQYQGITNLLGLARDPAFSKFIDKQKLFKKALEAMHLTPDDVMNPPDEIARLTKLEEQGPPPLPVQVAEIKKDAQVQAAQIAAQAKLQVQEHQDSTEQAYIETQRSIAQDSHAAALDKMRMQREILILQYANEQKLKLEDVKVKLAELTIKANLEREIHHSTLAANSANDVSAAA